MYSLFTFFHWVSGLLYRDVNSSSTEKTREAKSRDSTKSPCPATFPVGSINIRSVPTGGIPVSYLVWSSARVGSLQLPESSTPPTTVSLSVVCRRGGSTIGVVGAWVTSSPRGGGGGPHYVKREP